MRARLAALMVVALLFCGSRPVIYAAGEQSVRLLVGILEVDGDQHTRTSMYESIDFDNDGIEDEWSSIYFGDNHGLGEQDAPIVGLLETGNRIIIVSDDALRSVKPGPPLKVRTDEMDGARALFTTGNNRVAVIGHDFIGDGRLKNGRVRGIEVEHQDDVTFLAGAMYLNQLYVLGETNGIRSLYIVPEGKSPRYHFDSRDEVFSGLVDVETIVASDRGIFLIAMSVETRQLLITWLAPSETGLVPFAQMGIDLATSYSLAPAFAVTTNDRLYVGRDRQVFSVALSDEGFGGMTLYKELPGWFGGSATAVAVRK